ncbi:MAG: ABC transporter substrate-binding protein [Firmicutes bacterium HGW-Firmicutes-1]|nr:MAG: ABC transporter substrate-binding protein [Firmicutes bacterium HGW-Firmicutes-1]
MKKTILFVLICISLLMISCNKADILQKTEETQPIEIEFWFGLTGVQGDTMEDYIQAFNESQKEYVVKGVAFDSYDVTAKALETALAKGKGPSVVLLEDYQMYKVTEKGGIRAIDDLIEKSEDFNIDDIIPKFLNQVVVDDQIYGLPIYGTTQVMYYRKDLFEQEGIYVEQLNTWEDLAAAAKKLTKKSAEEVLVYGWEPMQGRENLIDATINRGGKLLNEEGTRVLIAEEPWIETWEQFRIWIHEDQIMKVHYGGEGWQYWYATIDDVLQGRSGGYTGSAGDFKEIDFNIIGAHIQPYWEGYEENPLGVYNAHTICIPVFTPEREATAAFEWIKYFTSTEITSKWSMETGYLPVRLSAIESREYIEFIDKHPSFKVTLEQMNRATNISYDPTGGAIYEALKIAAEKVEVLNIPADIALEEARNSAQKALDEVRILEGAINEN